MGRSGPCGGEPLLVGLRVSVDGEVRLQPASVKRAGAGKSTSSMPVSASASTHHLAFQRPFDLQPATRMPPTEPESIEIEREWMSLVAPGEITITDALIEGPPVKSVPARSSTFPARTKC